MVNVNQQSGSVVVGHFGEST